MHKKQIPTSTGVVRRTGYTFYVENSENHYFGSFFTFFLIKKIKKKFVQKTKQKKRFSLDIEWSMLAKGEVSISSNASAARDRYI